MNDFISFLKNLFKKPSDKVLAQQEIEEAKRQYLVHSTATEYHANLAKFYHDTVCRLQQYLKDENG